jgi:IS4 transposase
LHLVCGRGAEGYLSALNKAFEGIKTDAPNKSSLSKFRNKISYRFFSAMFYQLVGRFDPSRPTFRGYRVYAIDGKKAYIPRSEQMRRLGLKGRVLSDYRETYMMRLPFTHAYDVLSGTTKDIRVGPGEDEIKDACSMVAKFEANSISLYDRLYLCRKLIGTHLKTRSKFIMRAKSDSTLKEIVEFAKGREKMASFVFEGIPLFVVRSKGHKGGMDLIYLTNLDPQKFSARDIALLYRERWDVESSFKELADSLALESWHTKKYNGILQEFFARLWAFNFSKILMFQKGKYARKIGESYQRANFKLCQEWVLRHILAILKNKRGIFQGLKKLIKKSTERRKRYTRSYKRELKGPASPYERNNTVWVINGKPA